MTVISRARTEIKSQLSLLQALLDFSGAACIPRGSRVFGSIQGAVEMLDNRLGYLGIFLSFRNHRPPKYHRNFWILAGLSVVNCLLILTELGYEIFSLRQEYIKILVPGILFVAKLAAILNIPVLKHFKALILSILSDMDELLQRQDTEFLRIMPRHRDMAFLRIKKIFNFLDFVSVSGTFSLVFGGVAAGFLMDEQWNWWFPYHLPFLPPDTPTRYFLNLVHVFWGISFMWYSFCCLTEMFFFLGIGILMIFEILMDLIGSMELFVSENCFNYWVRASMDLLGTQRGIIISFKDATELILFFYEKFLFLCILSAWLAISIDVTQWWMASVPVIFTNTYFFIVLTNELFLQKFEDAELELYFLPWHTLPPLERRSFIPLLCATQNTISLSSGGLKDISLDWFTSLLNSAYSSCLLLGELLLE